MRYQYLLFTDDFYYSSWNRPNDMGIFQICPYTGMEEVLISSDDCRDEWVG
jgi:hypothetical protein